MKFIKNVRKIDSIILRQACIYFFFLLTYSACTKQQYYEGLNAGHRASCLEYPESEYDDCVDETSTSFEDYQNQREQVIGH